MMQRSSHIAVKVKPDQLEAAVAHYKAALGLQEADREEAGARLDGPNFTLWVDVDSEHPAVLQEFVATDREAARAVHERLGSRIYDEGDQGFHVEDPFGMHYHVWIEKAGQPAPIA